MEDGMSSNREKTVCYKTLHKASEWVGSCEHGTETSGSIKCGEYLN